MKKNKLYISFCIGIYNEESTIHHALTTIQNGLDKYIGKNHYEIILVDNGSNDKTPTVLKELNSKTVRTFSINEKGYGLAAKKAISEAKYENIVLSAIDLPFGFSDLLQVLPKWKKHDLIFGSKAHKKSVLYIPLQRRLSSYIYRFLLKVFFKLPINDTQGTIFLKKSSVVHILKHCDSPNAFFTAQLAIFGNLHNLRMTEIPVTMNKYFHRNSKYNIFKDGKLMLLSLINTYDLLRKIKSEEYFIKKK